MNPLANENAVVKIKKKMKKSKEIPAISKPVTIELIGMNNAIPICAEACSCCWDKVAPEDYDGKAEYIAKRSRIGHTSVLEHSNYVVYINADTQYTDDIMILLSWNHYLYTKLIKSEDGNSWHLIIGGSFRAYADLYRESDDLNNAILKAITGNLYTYGNSAAFEDIIKLGLLDKDMFNNIEPDENCCLLTDDKLTGADTDLVKIIGVDDVSKLYTNLYDASPEVASMVTTYDLIKFCTISVLFKNMSRTGTHQLVRHRNAITQESQRYVDYSKSCFTSPDTLKPEKYDSEHKYKIRFGTSAPMNLTLSEIGKAMCEIYEMLYNPAIAGGANALLKEDARAFLPNNVQCKKLYMTFTYKSFFKFLNLREDKAAQIEIRNYANTLGDLFRENTKFNSKEIMDLYTQPKLKVSDPFTFDIDLGEKEEVIDLTADDYIMAAGLDGEDDETIERDSNLKNGDEV